MNAPFCFLTRATRSLFIVLALASTVSLVHAQSVLTTGLDACGSFGSASLNMSNPDGLVLNHEPDLNLGTFPAISEPAGFSTISLNSDGNTSSTVGEVPSVATPAITLVPEPSAYAAILGAAALGFAAIRGQRRLRQKS